MPSVVKHFHKSKLRKTTRLSLDNDQVQNGTGTVRIKFKFRSVTPDSDALRFVCANLFQQVGAGSRDRPTARTIQKSPFEAEGVRSMHSKGAQCYKITNRSISISRVSLWQNCGCVRSRARNGICTVHAQFAITKNVRLR